MVEMESSHASVKEQACIWITYVDHTGSLKGKLPFTFPKTK